jgi:hypothetical protein
MKTTGKLLTLTILVLISITIIVPVSADLTIVPADAGTSYIIWAWDNPSNLSAMYIDNHLMCGYESTIPSVTILDIRPGSCHNITLFADVGNGTNVTCAEWGNFTGGGGSGESYGNVGGSMSNDSIMYGLVGACAGAVVLMGFFIKRRR